MAKVPFPNYDDRPINPYNKIGCGVNYGALENTGITFDHSAVGYLASTDAYFRLRHVCSLTPWMIGGSKDGSLDGRIWRFMDYDAFTDVVPWSSGPWNPPGQGDGAAYVAKWGVGGINGMGQAIELSDGGDITTPLSVKQWRSLIWLKAAIAHNGTRGITSKNYRDFLAFMWHCEITTDAFKKCPFDRVRRYVNEYIPAVVALMAYFEGVTDDINTLVFRIAGLTIDMRDVGRLRDNLPDPLPLPPVTAPSPSGWVAGKSVRAKKDILVRQAWGTDGKVMFLLKGGEFMKLVDGQVKHANGMEWIDIIGTQGSGWAPMQDLELASKETTSPGPIFQDFEPNRTFTVGPGGATIRQWANRDSAIVVLRVKPGTKILCDGYYFGEDIGGENRWLVQHRDPEEKEPRGRIHAGAFLEEI